MKFYLIDDDKNVLHILKRIIRDRNLGEIAGTAENGMDALADLPLLNPDIVIVDLLMPEMDGISFVKRAHSQSPSLTFIMLSQVASKDMIAEAYSAGVEFYIHKPINSIEVESVLRKVSDSLNARRTLQQVQTIFQAQQSFTQPQGILNDTAEPTYITRLKGILQKLGITGERGSKDIISLVDYLIQHNQKVDDVTLSELCSRFNDNPKSMEQRIRRTANMGMVNLANLGLEDYANDTFTTYSNSLYNFEQVRREMDFIRGKSVRHGNVKIKSFLNALIQECTERA